MQKEMGLRKGEEQRWAEAGAGPGVQAGSATSPLARCGQPGQGPGPGPPIRTRTPRWSVESQAREARWRHSQS